MADFYLYKFYVPKMFEGDFFGAVSCDEQLERVLTSPPLEKKTRIFKNLQDIWFLFSYWLNLF